MKGGAGAPAAAATPTGKAASRGGSIERALRWRELVGTGTGTVRLRIAQGLGLGSL